MQGNPSDTPLRVLVVGASGLVGGALLRAFGSNAAGTYHRTASAGLHRLDVTDGAAVDELLERLRPTLVIHPAAQPNVERCETEPEESHRVNVDGTLHVARAAKRIGARFVYFSTDYVFDGRAGPYPPEAVPAPLQTYGRHKLEAEEAIRALLDDYLIARVCGVYGYHPSGKNFIMALIRCARRREPMLVPEDQWGTPTFVDSLTAAMKELSLSTHVGVVHPVGPDYLSRIEFARLAAAILDLPPDVLQPRATAALRQRAARPLRGGVDNRSTQAVLATPLVGVRAGLAAVRRQMDADTDRGAR